MTESELLIHCKHFVDNKVTANTLCKKTLNVLDLYLEMKEKGVYDEDGNLQQKIISGEIIRNEKDRRRFLKKYYPVKSPGRPKKDEIRMLISLLATTFACATDSPTTLNREGDHPISPFELFCTPILNSLGIYDVRGWLSEHSASKSRECF